MINRYTYQIEVQVEADESTSEVEVREDALELLKEELVNQDFYTSYHRLKLVKSEKLW